MTREGEVSSAVEGDACLILRLVSLGGCELGGARMGRGAPVEVGGLYETETLWFGRGHEDEICGDELVGLDADDIADADVFPFALFKGRGRREDLGDAGVEFRVGLVSFLEENEGQHEERGEN